MKLKKIPAYDLLFGKFDSNTRYAIVFADARSRVRASNADYDLVSNASVLLVGDCHDALRDYMRNFRNVDLKKNIGMSPTVAAKLRDHLGISHGDGTRGGARPNAGNPAWSAVNEESAD